jgi:DNA polymerase-3 subunit gamma/tau
MSYLVLARKYRPQNFAELVGQEVLTTTLTNAILHNKLHQAYILCGIRGIGKTTTARIIAKTINCLDINIQNTAMACGKCKNCLDISKSQHQDIIEINAADHRGINDIRELIATAIYSPVFAKYKVYIIDEVHMLTEEAFNCLLKLLEEPPAHVKFILATTEIRDVPQTILSRCQKFNLPRLNIPDMVNHLQKILQQENFTAEESALNLIAKISEGSVRDALSFLDQALAINAYKQFLPTSVVADILGANNQDQNLALILALLQGNLNESFKIFHQIQQSNSDLILIAKDLLEIIHNICIIKLNTTQNFIYSQNQLAIIKQIAHQSELNHLLRCWHLINKSIAEINNSMLPALAFEIMLIKIVHVLSLPDLKQTLLDFNNLNHPNENHTNPNNDFVNNILQNFEGAKII